MSGLNEVDKFGLGGLLPLIRNENVDMAMFGLGTDLNQMGLELDQPEYGSIFLKNSCRDLSMQAFLSVSMAIQQYLSSQF